MGLLDRLLGRQPAAEPRSPGRASAQPSDDERALERYRYLVRTAPPDRLEEAHREAFERLTPEQRRQALEELSREVPQDERPTSDEPRALARAATRAEMREPGSVERAFGRGGMGGGGMPSMLGMFATVFIGTLAAQALFSEIAGDGGGDSGSEDASADDASGDASADAGGADAGDMGGGDAGGGGFDFGGGSDFGGGGDFGGF